MACAGRPCPANEAPRPLSTRNLYALLNPTTLAVIGASARPDRIGATVWRNLRAGSFKGMVYAVNPKHRRLDGQIVFASVPKLPQTPDLAVICSPPHTVRGHRRRARSARHPCRAGAHHRHRRGAAPGDARRRAAAPAARAGAGQHRRAGAAHRAEREPGHQRCAARRVGLHLAVGRAGQRDARLGVLARHRLLARGDAGSACRRGRGRPARPPGQRRAGAGDPAVHRRDRRAAQVPVGGARGGAQQAGDRGAFRRFGAARAPRRRPGVRRSDRARRHVAREHAAADAAGRRGAGPLSRQAQRAAVHRRQQRRGGRDGRRCRGPGRAAAVPARDRDAAKAAGTAARRNTGPGPIDARRQRHWRTICRGAATAARRRRSPGVAGDPRPQRGGAERDDRPRAAAAGTGHAAAADGLLARRLDSGRGAQPVPAGRHPQLRHPGSRGGGVLDAGGLPPQPGAADRGPAQHQPGHRRVGRGRAHERWFATRWAAAAPCSTRRRHARCSASTVSRWCRRRRSRSSLMRRPARPRRSATRCC